MLSLADGGTPDLARLFEPDEFGIVAERYPSGFAGGARRPWVARIDGTRKGVGPSSAGFQLFDLGADFARDMPLPISGVDSGSDLQRKIDSYWEVHRDRREKEGSELSDQERSRLRSLGYVRCVLLECDIPRRLYQVRRLARY